jgi:hypothetical protein
MTVEDYSNHYYETIAKTPVPNETSGKFVHIVGPDDEFLVVSPIALTEYHAHIVERFCKLRPGVSCTLTAERDDGAFDLSYWQIRGGGRFRLDREARTLSLWDVSKAFGPFDGPHIKSRLTAHPHWKDHEIRIT